MKKILFTSLILSACVASWAQGGSQPSTVEKAKSAAHMAMCDHCGTVQAVRQEKRKGEGGAVGIVGGAVVGGLVGNQFGKGSGKDLATVGGAVAGGFAGNEVQKHVTSKQVWVTKVKMKDGSIRTFEQAAKPNWVAGSHVKVQDNKTLSRI